MHYKVIKRLQPPEAGPLSAQSLVSPCIQYRAWTQEILPLINICQKGKKERRRREENNTEWLHVLANHWHAGGDWLLWAEKRKDILEKEWFLLATLKSTQRQTNTPSCFLVCPVTISLICLAGEPEAKSIASGATVQLGMFTVSLGIKLGEGPSEPEKWGLHQWLVSPCSQMSPAALQCWSLPLAAALLT